MRAYLRLDMVELAQQWGRRLSAWTALFVGLESRQDSRKPSGGSQQLNGPPTGQFGTSSMLGMHWSKPHEAPAAEPRTLVRVVQKLVLRKIALDESESLVPEHRPCELLRTAREVPVAENEGPGLTKDV